MLAAEKRSADEASGGRRVGRAIRNQSDPLIRTEIIHTLGSYPDPAGDPILEKALNDPDVDVAYAACESLGKRRPASGFALGPAFERRHEPGRAAGRRPRPGQNQGSAIDSCLGDALLVSDSDPAMQYRAVLSLKEATGKDLGNDVDRWRQYVKEDASGRPSPPRSPKNQAALSTSKADLTRYPRSQALPGNTLPSRPCLAVDFVEAEPPTNCVPRRSLGTGRKEEIPDHARFAVAPNGENP